MRVIQLGVHDPDYPRNRAIRHALSDSGHEVSVVELHTGSYPRRCLSLLARGIRAGRADVVILAELGVQYALVGRILASLRRATYCVDFFVGMYESNILDWQESSPQSVRARSYDLLDRAAIRSADVLICDTGVRAAFFGRRRRKTATLGWLPVGAPAWASPLPGAERTSATLRILFYGNYIPLHGVGTILRAISIAAESRDIELTLIGGGSRRDFHEALAHTLGLSKICTFLDPVPETALSRHISECDVVLGIFGGSDKAATVIANKVWQGLACGRHVVTRSSPALAEISELAGGWLIQVPPEDPAALAASLVAVNASERGPADGPRLLAQYVESKFADFVDTLDSLAS